jgi:hypothetical protein
VRADLSCQKARLGGTAAVGRVRQLVNAREPLAQETGEAKRRVQS